MRVQTMPPTSALQRRHARPLGAERQFGRALHAQPCLSAAVAEVNRST